MGPIWQQTLPCLFASRSPAGHVLLFHPGSNPFLFFPTRLRPYHPSLSAISTTHTLYILAAGSRSIKHFISRAICAATPGFIYPTSCDYSTLLTPACIWLSDRKALR